MSRLLKQALSLESVNDADLINIDVEMNVEEMEHIQSIESITRTLESSARDSDHLLEQMSSLESLYDLVESSPTFTVEHLNYVQTMVDVDVPTHTLESGDSEALRALTLESIGSFWNRIKQTYVSGWHTQIDGWNQLISGYKGLHARHTKINAKLTREWNLKKGDLKDSRSQISAAGYVANSMWVEGNLTKDPISTLTRDVAVAEEIVLKYPPAMVAYAKKLSDIISKGKYDTDSNFESTVLKPIVSLGHPRAVFGVKIPSGGLPMHVNHKLIEKAGKTKAVSGTAGKLQRDIAHIADGTYIKHSVWGDKIIALDTVRDIDVTIKDLDKLLALHMQYTKLLGELTGRLQATVDVTKGILKDQSTMSTIGDLSSENRRAVSDVAKLLKSMKKYLKSPVNDEGNRITIIVNGTRTMCSRAIATWK